MQAICQNAGTPLDARALEESLSALLDSDRSTLRPGTANDAVPASVPGSPWYALTAIALIRHEQDAVPSPAHPRVLVDLLKHPFCVGKARRMVLDQLGRHYRQSFADQWEFVTFAGERQLGFDLTSPIFSN
jgi:hypothetical protein